MADSDKSIFRKEAVDRINSPEQLNQYIKVTRPSVWMLFTAVVVLMAGLMFWVVKGEMESYVFMVAISENGQLVAYADPADVSRLSLGDTAVLDRQYETVISAISPSGIRVPEDLAEEYKEVTGPGERAYVVTLEYRDIPDGVYRVEVMVEQMRPLDYFIGVR